MKKKIIMGLFVLTAVIGMGFAGTCPSYNGTKKFSCRTCLGTGSKQCTGCYGRGYNSEVINSKFVKVTCSVCDGDGKVNCGICYGSRKEECPNCHGVGYIYDED